MLPIYAYQFTRSTSDYSLLGRYPKAIPTIHHSLSWVPESTLSNSCPSLIHQCYEQGKSNPQSAWCSPFVKADKIERKNKNNYSKMIFWGLEFMVGFLKLVLVQTHQRRMPSSISKLTVLKYRWTGLYPLLLPLVAWHPGDWESVWEHTLWSFLWYR